MIAKLWRVLFGGCEHKWKILNSGYYTSQGITKGSWYDLQCEHCGGVKKSTL